MALSVDLVGRDKIVQGVGNMLLWIYLKFPKYRPGVSLSVDERVPYRPGPITFRQVERIGNIFYSHILGVFSHLVFPHFLAGIAFLDSFSPWSGRAALTTFAANQWDSASPTRP